MIEQVNEMNLEKKKAVIILGAGIMQLPAIKTAQEEGYSAVVFDGNPDPVGKENADEFFNIDIKDYETIYSRCIGLGSLYDLKGILTVGTDFSYIAAKISEMIKLPGISYSTALKATVKSEMRKTFREHNVNSPAYFTADSTFDPEKSEYNISFPLVVKPVDSMGGRGSVKIESESELENAVKNAVVYSRSGKAIVEEYLDGPEFSLDAIIEDSRITICGIADRHIFFPPFFVEMGHTMPSIYPESVQEKVKGVFKKGIKAIGIDNGAAKGDIKYNGKDAAAGEIAARLSGGYMSGWTFPYSSGVSVIKAALNIATGKPSGLGEIRYSKTAAERAFISISGIVDDIIIPEYLEKDKYPEEIKDVFINIKKGDRVVFPRNNVQKCGNIIAVHSVREKAVEAAEKGCRDIIVRLKSCDIDTEKYILDKKEEWIPDAFELSNAENIKILNKMLSVKEGSGFSTAGKIAVAPLLYPEKEKNKDWQGRGFNNSLETVLKITGAEIEKKSCSYNAVLGKLFWNAFLRGGVQGGIWIIDTVEKYLKEGELPPVYLK